MSFLKTVRSGALSWLVFAILWPNFAQAEAAPQAILPDPLAAGWQGESVCEKLHESASQRILRCTFPPGIGHEKHFHVAHFGYAISGGRMRIESDSGVREVDLASGSSYTSNGTPWHEVLNIGDTTVQYLIVEDLSQAPTASSE